MKKYDEQKNLMEVRCNKCGCHMRVEKGIVKEGIFSIQYQWGYFSEKDGEIHDFDMCEKCYDEFVQTMMLSPVIGEAEELL